MHAVDDAWVVLEHIMHPGIAKTAEATPSTDSNRAVHSVHAGHVRDRKVRGYCILKSGVTFRKLPVHGKEENSVTAVPWDTTGTLTTYARMHQLDRSVNTQHCLRVCLGPPDAACT